MRPVTFVAPRMVDCAGADTVAASLSTYPCGTRPIRLVDLIHRRDGKWAFSYQPGDDDDEPIFRFDTHRFVAGEYVSITEHDGIQRPFKVVKVTPKVA